MSLSRSCICIFAKPPLPGLVKTRLAAELGEDLSAALASAFLCDVWAMSTGLPGARVVLATPDPDSRVDELGEIERWNQGEGDLGERIQHVMERALRSHTVAVALGGDSPDLPAELVIRAVEALRRDDAVFCPSSDGGFVLMAVRRLPENALHGLPWSAPNTLDAVINRFQEQGLSVHRLEPWDDVDVVVDLRRLVSRLRKGSIAEYTRQILIASGHFNE